MAAQNGEASRRRNASENVMKAKPGPPPTYINILYKDIPKKVCCLYEHRTMWMTKGANEGA
jgi:hypothetical protein